MVINMFQTNFERLQGNNCMKFSSFLQIPEIDVKLFKDNSKILKITYKFNQLFNHVTIFCNIQVLWCMNYFFYKLCIEQVANVFY